MSAHFGCVCSCETWYLVLTLTFQMRSDATLTLMDSLLMSFRSSIAPS